MIGIISISKYLSLSLCVIPVQASTTHTCRRFVCLGRRRRRRRRRRRVVLFRSRRVGGTGREAGVQSAVCVFRCQGCGRVSTVDPQWADPCVQCALCFVGGISEFWLFVCGPGDRILRPASCVMLQIAIVQWNTVCEQTWYMRLERSSTLLILRDKSL